MLPSSLRQRVLAGEIESIPVSDLGMRGRGVVYLTELWCVSLIDRKSRFLRKDAHKFIDLLAAVRSRHGEAVQGHVLVRTAPVCSQARAWLAEQGVDVEQL